MKLTSLAIIFIIIISPFIFLSAQESEASIQDQRLRYYYDNAIDNAVQDAAFILSQSLSNISYSTNMEIDEAKKIAAQAFFDSIYYAFNANANPVSMARVDACIPILIFLENEGCSIYALSPYKNANLENEVRHCWFPLQHYIGEPIEGRYLIRYSLRSKVYVYDNVEHIEYEGDYWEFKDKIMFFKDPTSFENLRISAVKNSVQAKLKDYMNNYNQWATGRSISVQLKLPAISDSDWMRAITDEGLLVFAQGFPTLRGKKYQHYALGGGRVIRKAPIIGYSYEGIMHYCTTNCNYYLNTVITDPIYNPEYSVYFSDAYEAARNGYYSCPHCSAP